MAFTSNKMINLYYNSSGRGPGKVINNLKLGLKLLENNYTDNFRGNNNYSNLILQDHWALYSDKIINSIIGPNVCVLPIDNSVVMSKKYKKILVPSQWVKNLYMKWLPEDKIEIWPVGIDTDLFYDMSKEKKEIDCLIYFKRRQNEELNSVIEFLESNNQSYEVISYGSYSEEHFISVIKNCRYGIVIDKCESQGLAIEEMMSCNLPLLVWDVMEWSDRGDDYKIDATSVPYWSETCGIKFNFFNELSELYVDFIKNLPYYNPRKYIQDNLTLEKTTKKLINLLYNE